MNENPPTPGARATYERFAGAMAYVAVKCADGFDGIGSAFHVGEGVFVTARHVVEGKKIVEVATFASVYIRLEGEEAEKSLCTVRKGDEEYKVHLVEPAVLTIRLGPLYHPDPTVDVAGFKVAEIDSYMPVVPLGSHLDDWLGRDDMVLVDVLILGFPPVPFAHGPHLIAARGQVNAMVDLGHTKHVHFIVSATPRGGFSGGLVVTEAGFTLGVITQSLLMNNLPEQLGYMAVLSVEPIFVCLAEHRLLPAVQAEGWDDFWNSESITFVERCAGDLGGVVMVAQVQWIDDGRNLWVDMYCPDHAVREESVRKIFGMLELFGPQSTPRGDNRIRVVIERRSGAAEGLEPAARAAAAVLDRAGYKRDK